MPKSDNPARKEYTTSYDKKSIVTEGNRTYFKLVHRVTGFHELRKKALASPAGKISKKINISSAGGYDWYIRITPNSESKPGSLSVCFAPKNRNKEIVICFAIAIMKKNRILKGQKAPCTKHRFKSNRYGTPTSYDMTGLGGAELPDTFKIHITCEICGKCIKLPHPRLYDGPKFHMDMFIGQTNTDVTLKGKSYELHAHSQFLNAYSPRFRASLNGGFAESKTKTIAINESISEEAMNMFLSMLYGACITSEDFLAMAPQILVLSSEYNVEGLSKICLQWIASSLCPATVVDKLLLADRYEEEFPSLKKTVYNLRSRKY